MADTERITLKDIAASVDTDIAAMRSRMAGPTNETQFPPKVIEAVRLLMAEPILQAPCVEWIRTKLAQVSQAKLVLLYGQERAMAMIEAAKTQGQTQ